MSESNIPYKSFCWVIGTTSFRTAKLNLKIEQQLSLLDDFFQTINSGSSWQWDNDLQAKYYEYLREKGFIAGNASIKDKDAREKTSGLVDIGLLSEDRRITDAGWELLAISREGSFTVDNIFNISKDSFVYLKQLLTFDHP